MKVLFAILLSTSLFLGIITPVKAHLANQPPFFKVNGVYTPLYPISPDYNTEITLPQDLAPDKYYINQPIDFELDQNALPIVPQILNQVKFDWDFGDGTKKDGVKNSHTYTKPGSYIITINVQYGSDLPQLLQSTLIHILPDSNYQLPQPVMTINGKQTDGNPQNRIKLYFGKQIELNGSSSYSNSSKIVSYEWNFDNSESINEKIAMVTYGTSIERVYPVLKITDENGFVSYGIVGLENGGFFAESPIGFILNRAAEKQPLPIKIGVGVIIMLLIYLLVLLIRRVIKKIK